MLCSSYLYILLECVPSFRLAPVISGDIKRYQVKSSDIESTPSRSGTLHFSYLEKYFFACLYTKQCRVGKARALVLLYHPYGVTPNRTQHGSHGRGHTVVHPVLSSRWQARCVLSVWLVLSAAQYHTRSRSQEQKVLRIFFNPMINSWRGICLAKTMDHLDGMPREGNFCTQ